MDFFIYVEKLAKNCSLESVDMLNMKKGLVLQSFSVFCFLFVFNFFAPVFPGWSVEIPSLLWAQQCPETETEKYIQNM